LNGANSLTVKKTSATRVVSREASLFVASRQSTDDELF
jgi:hypothetical protein